MVAIFTEKQTPFAPRALRNSALYEGPCTCTGRANPVGAASNPLAAAMILPEPRDVFNPHGPLSGTARSAVDAR